MQSVRDALRRYLGGSITPENPPVGESQSNGAAEESGKTIGGVFFAWWRQAPPAFSADVNQKIADLWIPRKSDNTMVELLGVVLATLSMVAWGSWPNTLRASRVRLEIFYYHYSVALLVSLATELNIFGVAVI